jgi:hypothetical protein
VDITPQARVPAASPGDLTHQRAHLLLLSALFWSLLSGARGIAGQGQESEVVVGIAGYRFSPVPSFHLVLFYFSVAMTKYPKLDNE